MSHGSPQNGIAGVKVPAIAADDIRKRFGGVEALRGASIAVFPGEIVGLVGHNGAGKSTLVRILHGDLAADSGEMRLNGESVKFTSIADALHKGLGVVRQELDLVPDLTVAENIYLGDEAGFTSTGPARSQQDARERRAAARAGRALGRSGHDGSATCPSATSSSSPRRGRCAAPHRCSCSTSRPPR